MRWLKRLWPKRLAGQMIALLLLALVLAQIITLMIFADERRFAIRAADRSQLLGRTVSVARLLENSPPSLHRQILETASERGLRYWRSEASPIDPEDDHEHHDAVLRQRIADLLGDEIDREVRITLADDDDDWNRWWGRGGRDDEESDDRRRWHRHGHAPNVLVSMQLTGGAWLNLESRLLPPTFQWKLPALTWLGLMGVALSTVVILMVRRITRPMAALASAAERAGRGEAIEPLPEVGPVDVRQTTHAFNRMHDRLQRFVKDRTQMLAAMSHDLRTPITTLRLRAEFIDDEEIKGKILETLEEMQRMTEATLAFVREEAAAEPTRKVDLAALIESVATDLADLGHDVSCHQGDRRIYACRPAGLKRALRNLLENAIRYGQKADVGLEENDDHLVIIIDDEGPGIPEDQIERLFQPFVRLDESRSEETGGIGLGLAIARSIIRSHGGDIHLGNREGGGLRATVTLPKSTLSA
ncbi:MAG: ATP-binding protein [Alphaproteobacteria bacterium]|nr:ATP-binding protein [Alphaproteobacteria bacterium]